MSDWRTAILDHFVSGISRLTLVADPDCLLSEEQLSASLRERGFDLLEFDDPIAFRYAYESRYRSLWDAGTATDLVVILRLRGSDLDSLPYDLLNAGRKLAFDLGSLFPNFSYPVLEQIEQKHLDMLHRAHSQFSQDSLGDNATKDFILRHVFGIAPELISDDIELLRKLLRFHYGGNELPETLCQRLVDVLRLNSTFNDWALEAITQSPAAFYAFLEERWPLFVSSACACEGHGNDLSVCDFQYAGPAHLPFGHEDIRVFIDNLFVEGKLSPVDAGDMPSDTPEWIKSGVVLQDEDNDLRRARRLIDSIKESVPSGEAGHAEWLALAAKWAELSAIVHSHSLDECREDWREVGTGIDTEFQSWLESRYAGLMTLPPQNPVMLHQIPRRLAREIEQSKQARVALIVVDGLSYDQWVTARDVLHRQDASLLIDEAATFALIPTTTSVSRQSMFSGKLPLYFPDSIDTTSREPELWQQFWQGVGLSRREIGYVKGLGARSVDGVLKEVDLSTVHALGLVIDKVDKIMHGMQLGSAGMHNQVRQWMEAGLLRDLVQQLLDHGFQVWLTSDHGNVECVGAGRPAEGVIAESRGERVRIYPSENLRVNTANSHQHTASWNPVGLPKDYFPLLATDRTAFVGKSQSLVAHGGSSIEEVIVPFVAFQRRER